jgi:hypothetical protein
MANTGCLGIAKQIGREQRRRKSSNLSHSEKDLTGNSNVFSIPSTALDHS